MCVQACPFGVIAMNLHGKGVLKCDLCIERLAEGQEPACVASCPTKAVTFESDEDANRVKRRKSAEMIVTAQEEGSV
jgi:formate dehydrogenase iron-sulfur subunit